MESKGLKNILSKLLKIQCELKVPKDKFSEFGNYHFRSCEDILEAAKPICKENGCVITLYDEITQIGDRYYVKATATIFDIESEESFVTSASAREEEVKPKLDRSQTTGSASSYARKYALNALLAIDDTADADALNDAEQKEKKKEKQTEKQTAEYKPVQKQPTSSVQYAQQTATPKTITQAQQKRLFAIGKEPEIRAVLAEYGIEHTKDIPMAKYDEICKKVQEKGGE